MFLLDSTYPGLDVTRTRLRTSRNIEYEQLAASMSTTRLLASYSRAKGTMYTRAVAVSDTEKVVTRLL